MSVQFNATRALDGRELTGKVHVFGRDRVKGWEEEDDADECGPNEGPYIHEPAKFAHVPWARFELSIDQLAGNGDAVAPIHGNGTHVEDGSNSLIRAQCNQVDGGAPEHRPPDGNDGRVSPLVNDLEVAGTRNQAIAGEGEHGTCERLDSSNGASIQNDESARRESDGTSFAEVVVKQLNHGLFKLVGKQLGRVAHGEA